VVLEAVAAEQLAKAVNLSNETIPTAPPHSPSLLLAFLLLPPIGC
jgi:hypothetical protein